jgi:hypothetical protein
MVATADRSPARYNFELIGGYAERPLTPRLRMPRIRSRDYQQLLANAGCLQGSTADYLRAHGVIVLQSY